MKKTFVFFILIILNFNLFSQTIDSIKSLILANKLIDAKTDIEVFLQQKENQQNPYAWYFKGYTYYLISKDSTINIPLTNVKAIAYNAFIQCLSIAPKFNWIIKENYKPIIDLYVSFYTKGKQLYELNNYENAFDELINAEKIQQYLYKNKVQYKQYFFPKIDTTLLYNIAIVALKLNNHKAGINYYIKIANAKIKDPAYLQIYHSIIQYFISINDEIGYRKYLKLGQQLFPFDNYWVQAERDMVDAGKFNAALISDYQQKIEKSPNNYDLHLQFCNDLMNIIFNKENNLKIKNDYKIKLENELVKTVQLQKSGVNAEYLYANYWYNEAIENKDSIEKSTDNNKAISYAETVFQYYENNTQLNRNELEIFNSITQKLIDIYTNINNDEMIKKYKEKLQLSEHVLPVKNTKKL